MLKALLTGAALAASLVTVAAPAAAAPRPFPSNKVMVDVKAANGSGCDRKSASVTVAPDSRAFTVTYSRFTAQVGVGAKPLDIRKNCQLALDVHVPQGFTFAILSADYRGFAHLEKGAKGSATSFYYFQGNPQTTKMRHNFAGYTDSDWQHTDKVGIASLSYLPCGQHRYLNVNTELKVDGGRSNTRRTTSYLTMDSTDGSVDTVYHVAWKKC